ncbi:MAG: hypothetical protein OCC49_01580 [Fibrobacterales bacterium]
MPLPHLLIIVSLLVQFLPAQTIDDFVDDLVNQMTLEEKRDQLSTNHSPANGVYSIMTTHEISSLPKGVYVLKMEHDAYNSQSVIFKK